MIERKIYFEKIKPFIDKEIIKVLTGIRRSGKSVMLKLIMKELKKNGIDENQFIYINFENLRNRHLCYADTLNEYILEKAGKIQEKCYLFLDEIQEVKEWEKCINSLRTEDKQFDIYITGSNAKLLSGELATYLAGRYVEVEIYPFSFKEFCLIYQNINQNISKEEMFEKYVKLGGMPFLHNLNYEVESSMQYLKDIYSSIILKDITQRNNIRNTELLERIINYIVMNIGNIFSANSISKYFKSENRKVAVDTVLNYIKIGKLNNLEIDFVCTKTNNEKIYIQVAYLLVSEDTIKREFLPFEKINDNYPKYVISMDRFDMSRNGIKHLNIINFLLKD